MRENEREREFQVHQRTPRAPSTPSAGYERRGARAQEATAAVPRAYAAVDAPQRPRSRAAAARTTPHVPLFRASDAHLNTSCARRAARRVCGRGGARRRELCGAARRAAGWLGRHGGILRACVQAGEARAARRRLRGAVARGARGAPCAHSVRLTHAAAAAPPPPSLPQRGAGTARRSSPSGRPRRRRARARRGGRASTRRSTARSRSALASTATRRSCTSRARAARPCGASSCRASPRRT